MRKLLKLKKIALNGAKGLKNLVINYKKIIILATLLALLLAGVGFKIYKKDKIIDENVYFTTQSGKKVLKTIDNPDLDSDADGLRDWEEPLYNTDPQNPDTDNDNYKDGEEISSGYDPTIPAPNDKKSEFAFSPRPVPQTLTENLTEQLFFLIAEKQINPADAQKALFSPELMQSQSYAAIGTAFENLVLSHKNLYELPEISDDIINISNDNSEKAKEEYAKKLKEISNVILEKNLTIDRIIEIFEEATYTKDFSMTRKIRDIFKKNYNKLIVLPVPLDFLQIHKNDLVYLAGMIQILSDVELIEKDPIRGAIAAEKLEVLTKFISESYEYQTGESLPIDFTKEAIEFEEEEY